MKFAIISGSHRPTAESGRVARWIEAEVKRIWSDASTYLLDLGKTPLPFWDESIWAGSPEWKQTWGPIASELQSTDAFVLIAPEWAGMVPPALKNFLLLCGKQEVGHKPAMIVTVSASRNGAYPVAELRMSGYKNNSIVWTPEHLIVREVKGVFQEAEPVGENDQYTRKRAEYGLRVLAEYAKALAQVRASGVLDHKTYPFGM